MEITETDTIRFWMTAEGREVVDLSSLKGDTIVYGVSLKNGLGFWIVPYIEKIPPVAICPRVFSFVGQKEGKRFAKGFVIDGYKKSVVMKRFARRVKEFGFESAVIFDIDPPVESLRS